MAIYGADLMGSVASHALESSEGSTSMDGLDGFVNNPDHTSSPRVLARNDREVHSQRSTTGTHTFGVRGYARLHPTFDPEAASLSNDDPLEFKFEHRDGRVLLRVYAWWSVATLEQFRSQSGVHVLCVMKYTSSNHYHQISLRVAVRRKADDDIPENWVGAAAPDIRIVYDHTQPSRNVVVGDLMVDATKLLCTSLRYAENVEGWKQRLGLLTEHDCRLAGRIRPTSITSNNANQHTHSASSPTSLADGNTAWNARCWNPKPDESGKVQAVFSFPKAVAIGRVDVYGTYTSASVGGTLYAPYHWGVEGSFDGVTYAPIDIVRCVDLCEKATDTTVVSKQSDNPSARPVSVDLDVSAGKFTHLRITFFDTYADDPASAGDTVPICEVEIHEFR